MNNLKNFLFTSESVSEGHPDKVSDRISDMVVDNYLANEPQSRVACETLTTTNKVVLAGEVRGPEIKKDELISKVRDCIKDIGYDQDGFSYKEATKIESHLHSQSADIAMGVDASGNKDEGAGDQGIMFGIRHISSGGIGFLYDYKGNDFYESGNFSQGTGYFYGLGLLIDDMGSDRHIGSRYSIASSAHSALGILINNKGNDSYQTLYGSSMGIAWDNSNSFFLDESGNDVYDCLDRNFS